MALKRVGLSSRREEPDRRRRGSGGRRGSRTGARGAAGVRAGLIKDDMVGE